jgi:hypothetical protein
MYSAGRAYLSGTGAVRQVFYGFPLFYSGL